MSIPFKRLKMQRILRSPGPGSLARVGSAGQMPGVLFTGHVDTGDAQLPPTLKPARCECLPAGDDQCGDQCQSAVWAIWALVPT